MHNLIYVLNSSHEILFIFVIEHFQNNHLFETVETDSNGAITILRILIERLT